MKEIEALQTASAWAAANSGGLPSVSATGGVITNIPAVLGRELLEHTSDSLRVLSDIASSPDSIIGAVITAIKFVVSSIKKAAAQREINYIEARLGYLAEARGVRLASKLAGYQGCGPGFWRYPRASIAKDHCVPIWDPLGTPGNLPSWMVPYGWEKGPPNPWWPAGSPTPVGNTLPRVCYDWEDINVDAGDSDCSVNANDYVIVAWPWAWPLCCPLRAAGSFLRYSPIVDGRQIEMSVAALYMLPTPQHILTRASDVAESKRIITAAMKWWWPKSYQADVGLWLQGGPPRASQGYDPKNPGSGADFALYANSLMRIHGFERCRAAMLKNPELIPYELQPLLKENPDFNLSTPTKPTKPMAGSKLGSVEPRAPASAGRWVAAGLGAAVVVGGITYYLSTRGVLTTTQATKPGRQRSSVITRHQRTGRR